MIHSLKQVQNQFFSLGGQRFSPDLEHTETNRAYGVCVKTPVGWEGMASAMP